MQQLDKNGDTPRGLEGLKSETLASTHKRHQNNIVTFTQPSINATKLTLQNSVDRNNKASFGVLQTWFINLFSKSLTVDSSQFIQQIRKGSVFVKQQVHSPLKGETCRSGAQIDPGSSPLLNLTSDYHFVFGFGEFLRLVFVHDHGVFYADPAKVDDVDTWLHGYYVSRLQDLSAFWAQGGGFVGLESNAVSQAVNEVFAIFLLFDEISCVCVCIACPDSRADALKRSLLSLPHDLIDLDLFR